MSAGTIITGQLRSSKTLADLVGPGLFGPADVAQLTSQSALGALALLCRTDSAGFLLVETADDAVAIRLSEGCVERTGQLSQPNDQALAASLIEHGEVEHEALLRAAILTDRTGEALARTLFARKLVPPRTLVARIRAAHRARLAWVAAVDEGRLTFASSETFGGRSRPSVASVTFRSALLPLLRDALRPYYVSDLEPALGPIAHRWIQRVDDVLGGLPLSERERHPVDNLLDGSYQLTEVLDLAIIPRSEMCRLLVSLLMVGAVRLERERVGPARHDPADELREVLRRFDNLDAFAVLEGHWTSHPEELKASYQRLRQRYDPEGPRMTADLSGLASRIVARLEEAWSKVARTADRIAYRREHVETSQLVGSAEMLHLQGRTAEFREDYPAALRYYEVALELRPDKRVQSSIKRTLAKRAGELPPDQVDLST